MMRLLVCALAYFVLANGMVYQTGVNFEADVNVTTAETDARFNFRENTVTEVLNMFTDVSVSVSASGSASGGSASGTFAANGIVATGVIPSSLFAYPPTISVAFFNETGSVSVSGSAAQLDVSASAAFVSKVFDHIEERNPAGGLVATINLANLTYTSSGIQVIDASKGLKSVTYTAPSGSATIAITIVISSVLGILDNGGAIITPASVESFFEIDNYQYASASNNLVLTMYLAHLSADIAITADGTITTGNSGSPDQIYIHMSDNVIVDGQTQSVTINGMGDANIAISSIPNTLLRAQLSSHGSLTADVRQVTVAFPPGINSLTYDPTIGFGDPSPASTYTGGSGTSTGTGNTISNSSNAIAFTPLFSTAFALAFSAFAAFLANRF